MNRVKRSMLVCMLAIVLTTLLTAEVAEAAGLTGGKWSIVRSPVVRTNNGELRGGMASAASIFWVVVEAAKSGAPGQTLIEHWNGTRWQVVSSPNVGSVVNQLLGVAAVSAS